MSTRIVTREEFDKAVEAIWTEIEYQNKLPRRTEDEATEHGSFVSLSNVYVRRLEESWADNPGVVPLVTHSVRKIAAIWIRCMIYNGILKRGDVKWPTTGPV